jgi:hypothetical protein
MYLSSRGGFLFLVLIVVIFAVTTIPKLYSQEELVTAKSIVFEETTIIEFKNSNDNTSEIDTFRMWLGSDSNFKSFKTERGWTGQKTPEGVIVFTTSNPLQPGEVVKFGVKTDKPKPGINWKALTNTGQQISTGKTLAPDSSSTESKIEASESGTGVLESSSFRLIPEKPSVGGSMRVTGENFAANHKLDFYIDNKKIESFETDGDGRFMFTSSIPKDQTADRVDFKIVDAKGNEKAISLRLGEETGITTTTIEKIPLTISAIPSIVYRGDTVKVNGTGSPGKTVTATIKDESDKIVTTIAVDVDLSGKWKYEGIIAVDTPLGKQTAEITDGVETILRTWTVESSNKIEIHPTKIRFEPGETIIFNGTAKPNEELEIVVEDPQGTEFYSKFLNIDSSGVVNIEFPTLISSIEGTYVLFASQGVDIDIAIVGLGEPPEEKIVAKPDKLNYATSEKALLEIKGPPSATVSLLIVDPSDKNKFTATIILGPDGKLHYELDLNGYASGVYTVVLTRGNVQTSEIFSVGLQTGSGEIKAKTTKETYQPGDSILILGASSKNILLTIELLDPDGKVVKTKETFTNKDGIISESSFRIPVEAKVGTWTIHLKSGPNFDDVKITVQGNIKEGLVIFVDKIDFTESGRIVSIKGFGAAIKQNVVITILDKSGVKITELRASTTGTGEFGIPWVVPSDVDPGTYTLNAKDPVTEAKITFVLK